MELETANAGAIASASETPSPAPAVEQSPTPEAQEAAIDADLQAVWNKHNPTRDESGRFQSKNPEAPAADETQSEATGEKDSGQTPEAETVETASKPSIDPPASWSREVREKWTALPPDLQEYISKRESEAHAQITRLGNTAKAAEPILSLIEQNRELFDRRQLRPEQGLAALLGAQRKLDTNPVSAIAELAQQYRVDLSIFANADGSQPTVTPQVAALQARIDHLERELSTTSSTVRQTQAERQAAELAKHQTTVETFLSGKNLTDLEADELVVILTSEKQLNPGKDAEQLLKDAYETFLYRSPERRQKVIQQQLAQEQAKQAEEAKKKATDAKKLASINVKSQPASSSSNKTMDDTLREIARRVYQQ
jgi:hypothetical protein